MFGIGFDGHPDLQCILMPDGWDGHPLGNPIPAGPRRWPSTPRRTSAGCSRAPAVFFRDRAGRQDLIVTVGPRHVSTHGLIRYVLGLDGETITDMDIEIGYHHRPAEKIGERQTWHQFIHLPWPTSSFPCTTACWCSRPPAWRNPSNRSRPSP